MKINLYIEIITHASYNIKRYYDVQGLCIKDIWKSEVDEMKKKPETGVQRTKRYRISDKKQTQPIYEMVPYFEEALLLGDSLAESILDFRPLRKNNVVANRSRCIDDIQGDLLFAISMQPAVIFMEYGKNDILHSHKDFEAFITCYRKQIRILQSALPKTAIYIHSILPLRSDIMCSHGGTQRHRNFNQGLETMCAELQLTFVDNSQLLKWEDAVYEYDGIHPKYPFYPKWLRHMADCAGLLSK